MSLPPVFRHNVKADPLQGMSASQNSHPQPANVWSSKLACMARDQKMGLPCTTLGGEYATGGGWGGRGRKESGLLPYDRTGNDFSMGFGT